MKGVFSVGEITLRAKLKVLKSTLCQKDLFLSCVAIKARPAAKMLWAYLSVK